MNIISDLGTIVGLIGGLIGAVGDIIGLAQLRKRPRLNFLTLSATAVKPRFFTQQDMSAYIWGKTHTNPANPLHAQRFVINHLLDAPMEQHEEKVTQALRYVEWNLPDFQQNPLHPNAREPLGVDYFKIESNLLLENKGSAQARFRLPLETTGQLQTIGTQIPPGVAIHFVVTCKDVSDEVIKIEAGELKMFPVDIALFFKDQQGTPYDRSNGGFRRLRIVQAFTKYLNKGRINDIYIDIDLLNGRTIKPKLIIDYTDYIDQLKVIDMDITKLEEQWEIIYDAAYELYTKSANYPT